MTKRKEKVLASGCIWSETQDGNWETQCGEMYVINVGLPSENKMKFCCYCGKKLKEELFVEDTDDR